MTKQKNKLLYKFLAAILIISSFHDNISFAEPFINALAIQTGNPGTYRNIVNMMKGRSYTENEIAPPAIKDRYYDIDEAIKAIKSVLIYGISIDDIVHRGGYRGKKTNMMIAEILSNIYRDDKKLFIFKGIKIKNKGRKIPSTLARLSGRKNLDKRLEVLRFMYGKKHDGQFLFNGTDIVTLMTGTRPLENDDAAGDIKSMTDLLIKEGNDRGRYIALILSTSRQRRDIADIMVSLRNAGIHDRLIIAEILSSSRSRDEILRIIDDLKGYQIDGVDIASIIRSGRCEKDIKYLVDLLVKNYKSMSSFYFARIIASSRGIKDIEEIIKELAVFGIKDLNYVSMVISCSRTKNEIISLIRNLLAVKKFTISQLVQILHCGRPESDIIAIKDILASFGIQDNYPVVSAVISPRAKDDIEKLIKALMAEEFNFIDKRNDIPLILRSPRDSYSVIKLIRFLRKNGIDKGTSVARMVNSPRSPADMRSIIIKMRAFGINDPDCMAFAIISSRSRESINSILVKFFKKISDNKIKIGKEYLIGYVICNSRDAEDLMELIDILISAGMKDLKDMGPIVASRRSVTDIKYILSVLHDLGINKDSVRSSVISSSRPKDRIGPLISSWMADGFTDHFHISEIVSSSRSGDDIREMIDTLRELGIRENIYIAALIHSSYSKEFISGILKDIGPEERVKRIKLLIDGHKKEERMEFLTGFNYLNEPDDGSHNDESSLKEIPFNIMSSLSFDNEDFRIILSDLLRTTDILNDDKSVFVFSQKVTFGNGFGQILPSLAEAGIKVAVVANTDRERELIDNLNTGKEDSRKIIRGETISEVMIKFRAARYYYFKVKDDTETGAGIRGVSVFDITDIVGVIIDMIGNISGLTDRSQLDLLRRAVKEFARSA